MDETNHSKLVSLLRGMRENPQIITRVVLDEYQVSFRTHEIEFCAFISVVISAAGGEDCIMEADWHLRSDSSYKFCSIVGHSLESGVFTKDGLELEIDGFGTLLLTKQEGKESFHVDAASLGGAHIY